MSTLFRREEQALTTRLSAMLKSPRIFEMGDDKIGDLYTCGGCTDQIPTNRARISCRSCLNYHLCANCFVIKQFSRPHIDRHPTLVNKESGLVVSTPPSPPNPPQPIQAAETELDVPVANWGALWSLMKAPLEKKSKKGSPDEHAKTATPIDLENIKVPPTTGDGEAKEALLDPPKTPFTSFPPSPPRSIRRNTEPEVGSAPSYPQPAEWELLFEEDCTPTPNFIALMSTIFSHLDPGHTGYLSPETYSGFLDVQGYKLEGNIWKRALETKGREHIEMGDLELGDLFSDLGISHQLAARPKAYPTDDSVTESKSLVQEKIKDSTKSGANMPMISRQGFIDLSAIEYLVDPSKAHEHLGRAVSIYGIWKELGPMPRSVLPDSPMPNVLQFDKESDDDEGAETQRSETPEATDSEEKHKVGSGDEKFEARSRADDFVDVDFTKEEKEAPSKAGSIIEGKSLEA